MPILQVLVSGDEVGVLNIWCLDSNTPADGLIHKHRIENIPEEGTVMTISLWNKIEKGIAAVGFSSGQIRLFSVSSGQILAQVNAHAAWITGMDLASQTGTLITSAEDGFIRVRTE